MREKDLELLPSALVGSLAWRRQQRGPGSLWLPQRLQRSGLTESFEDARGTRWNPLTPAARVPAR